MSFLEKTIWLLSVILILPMIFFGNDFVPNEFCRISSCNITRNTLKPGECLCCCLVVENQTSDLHYCKIVPVLPDNWECLATPQECYLVLSPNTSDTILIPVKAPLNALPNSYPLTFHLVGLTPHIDSITLDIEIEEIVDIKLTVRKPPPFLSNEKKISLTHTVENCGNLKVPIKIDVYTTSDLALSTTLKSEEILPDSAFEFDTVIDLIPGRSLGTHYVFFKIVNAENDELLAQDSFSFEILSSHYRELSLNRTIPGRLTLYSLTDNGHEVCVAEISGNGPIHPESDIKTNFFFRIPSDTRRNIYGIDQVLFAGFEGKNGFLNIGDTAYSQSFLTEKYRYARGVGMKYFLNRFECGAYYAKQPHGKHYKLNEAGSTLAIWKNRSLRCAVNYLHKD